MGADAAAAARRQPARGSADSSGEYTPPTRGSATPSPRSSPGTDSAPTAPPPTAPAPAAPEQGSATAEELYKRFQASLAVIEALDDAMGKVDLLQRQVMQSAAAEQEQQVHRVIDQLQERQKGLSIQLAREAARTAAQQHQWQQLQQMTRSEASWPPGSSSHYPANAPSPSKSQQGAPKRTSFAGAPAAGPASGGPITVVGSMAGDEPARYYWRREQRGKRRSKTDPAHMLDTQLRRQETYLRRIEAARIKLRRERERPPPQGPTPSAPTPQREVAREGSHEPPRASCHSLVSLASTITPRGAAAQAQRAFKQPPLQTPRALHPAPSDATAVTPRPGGTTSGPSPQRQYTLSRHDSVNTADYTENWVEQGPSADDEVLAGSGEVVSSGYESDIMPSAPFPSTLTKAHQQEAASLARGAGRRGL